MILDCFPSLMGELQSHLSDTSKKVALHSVVAPYIDHQYCLCLRRSGTIDIYEFSALWKYIQQWKQCFDR